MKNYRLGYDYLIVCPRPFEHEGQIIMGMAMDVLFKVVDESDNEVYFQGEELVDKKFNFNGNYHYLCDLIKCSYDKENGLTINPNFEVVPNLKGYGFQFEIQRYYKDIKGELPEELKQFGDFPCSEPIAITKEEFWAILNEYPNAFEEDTRLQTTAYFTEEITYSK